MGRLAGGPAKMRRGTKCLAQSNKPQSGLADDPGMHTKPQNKTILTEAAGRPEKSKPAGLVADGQFSTKCLGSELSRQIAVDLESDADLDEGRGCPGHWRFPSVFMNTARYIGSGSQNNLRGAQFACDRTITAATSASIAAAALPQHLLPVPTRAAESKSTCKGHLPQRVEARCSTRPAQTPSHRTSKSHCKHSNREDRTKNSVGLKPLIEFTQFFRRHSMMRDLICHVCLLPNQNSQRRDRCSQLRDEWFPSRRSIVRTKVQENKQSYCHKLK
jgi:hypothetical protein